MRRSLLLLLLLGALVAPSAVQGAPFTPGLELAFHVANRYWGGPPPGCTSIDKQIVPDGSLPEEHEAEATIPGPGEHVACFVYVTRHLAKPEAFAYTCTTLVHEDGHLHGLGHSSEPGNVMNPEARIVPNICWRADLRRMNEVRYHPETSTIVRRFSRG